MSFSTRAVFLAVLIFRISFGTEWPIATLSYYSTLPESGIALDARRIGASQRDEHSDFVSSVAERFA